MESDVVLKTFFTDNRRFIVGDPISPPDLFGTKFDYADMKVRHFIGNADTKTADSAVKAGEKIDPFGDKIADVQDIVKAAWMHRHGQADAWDGEWPIFIEDENIYGLVTKDIDPTGIQVPGEPNLRFYSAQLVKRDERTVSGPYSYDVSDVPEAEDKKARKKK